MDSILKDVQRSPEFKEWMRSQGPSSSGDSEMQKQLAATWAMLDKMAKDNPRQYKEFVDKMMKEAETYSLRKQGAIEITPHYSFETDVGSRIDGLVELAPGRSSFKAPLDMRQGQALFINVCSHPRISPPVFPGEKAPTKLKPVDTPVQTLLNIQVDMMLSPARRITRIGAQGQEEAEEGGGSVGERGWHVDVVISPWVAQAAEAKAAFQKELLVFLRDTVCEELGLGTQGTRQPCKVVGEVYVGGTGPEGTKPQPFKAEWAGAPPPSDTGGSVSAAGAGRGKLATQSPIDLLKANSAPPSSASRGPSADHTGLEGLLSVGMQLASSEPPPAVALPAGPDAAAALAAAVAETLPLEAQLAEGAATVHTSSSCNASGSTTLTVSVRLHSGHVHLPEVKMSEAQLDVEPRQLTLRLPRRLLLAYKGLELSHVLVALTTLPMEVDVDSVRAKFNKAEATLVVSMRAVA